MDQSNDRYSQRFLKDKISPDALMMQNDIKSQKEREREKLKNNFNFSSKSDSLSLREEVRQ